MGSKKIEGKSEGFNWTWQREKAVLALAVGKTRIEAAKEARVVESTIYEWLKAPGFTEELDRLSLMVGIASRAERLRIANRVVRQKTEADGKVLTEKDILDWLKFAQSETDGVKLDLAKLAAALGQDETSLAD